MSKGDLFLPFLTTPDTAIIATTTKWISNGAAAKHKRKLLTYLHYAGIYYVNHHHIFRMGGGKMLSLTHI